MQISSEDKDLIRNNLFYNKVLGHLNWRNGSKFRPFIGANPVSVETVQGHDMLVVRFIDRSFDAADICWFLWKKHWPKHGVVFADKSKEGRRNLRPENLRSRRRPVYVKQGRACWVPRRMIETVAETLRFHGEGVVADELMALKEVKR
jgi:hypothetical protein